jgi:hypothetical protein
MSKLNEKKVAASSYIINFYQTIEELTNNYAVYFNDLLNLKEKYAGEVSKMDPSEKEQLTTNAQTIRFNVNRSFIKLKALKDTLNVKLSKEIEDAHKEIIKTFIIKEKDLEKYVVEINKILLFDIVQSLLQTSQEVVSNIYDNESTNNAKSAD